LQGSRTIAIAAGVLALAGCVVYAELISDWRTARSDGNARFALSVTYSLSLVDYNRMVAENKQKYGDRAETNLDVKSGIIEVKVDGNTIETRAEGKTLEGVQGIFVIGTEDKVSARFPFQIDFKSDFSDPTRSMALFLKERYKKAPRQWFEFSDADWTIDRCAALPKGFGLGILGKGLDLHKGTSCVVSWNGQEPSSMLVAVGRADGDPWMRPFARRICREMVDSALERFNPDGAGSPKYAACILADRPAYVSAQKSLVIEVYSVEPHNQLARLDRLPASK
jgi:hypothetical protein